MLHRLSNKIYRKDYILLILFLNSGVDWVGDDTDDGIGCCFGRSAGGDNGGVGVERVVTGHAYEVGVTVIVVVISNLFFSLKLEEPFVRRGPLSWCLRSSLHLRYQRWWSCHRQP